MAQEIGDAGEALRQGERLGEAHPLDPVAGQRGDAGRIGEHSLDEPVAAGWEIDDVDHGAPSGSVQAEARTMAG